MKYSFHSYKFHTLFFTYYVSFSIKPILEIVLKSLGDTKSPQVSKTLLSILAMTLPSILTNAVICIVSILIFNSFKSFFQVFRNSS